MHRTICLGILLLVITIAAYGKSFQGAFLLDDTSRIVGNEKLQALARGDDNIWSHLSQRFVGRFSLALNYAIGGEDVTGYHVVNLCIHLAAGLFLFGIIRRTLMRTSFGSGDSPTASYLAAAIALVWLVHPLQTQSVTYIIQRYESMMGMFYLACIYFVIRSDEASRSWAWQAAAVLACWMGMGTKAVMITAPLVTLLYDRIFLAGAWSVVVRRRGLMYLAFLPAMVWLMVTTARVLFNPENTSAGFNVRGVSWLEYLGSEGGVILHYLRLTILPDPLCLDYRWPVAHEPLAILLPGAIISALLVAGVFALAKRPRLGFLGFSFFLVLAPTSSVVPLSDLAVEHRMYLPLAPIVILIVLGAVALVGRSRASVASQRYWLGAAFAVVAVTLTMLTFARNGVYSSPVGMWENVLATVPENPRAHYNLGVELEKVDRAAEASDSYRRAVDLSPGYADAHTNLGILLMRQGKLDEAAGHLQLAMQLKPDSASGYNNLGNVLMKLGKRKLAKRYLERALEINPDYAGAYHNLGILLVAEGDDAAARSCLENAVRLNPNLGDAHFQLGMLFGRTEKYDRAKFHFDEALRIDPGNAQAHYYLGNAYGVSGDERQAAEHFRQAVSIQPTLVAATKNLVWILAAHADPNLRNGQEAVSWAEKSAVVTGRTDPIVLDMLAASYAEVGRWNDAVTTAGEAIELATAIGRGALAHEIALRRQLYQRRQPYRKPSVR